MGEIKRKSFEAGEKRLSSSEKGLSEELPRVLSRETSPIRTITPVTPVRSERRSWHGNSFKVTETLTAAELLNVDKFEDTGSSGSNAAKSAAGASFRSNEIVFFKANP